MLRNSYFTTLLTAIFFLPLLVVGVKFPIRGVGELDEEIDTTGTASTWTATLPLEEKYKRAPTVENCEHLASKIYQAIIPLLKEKGGSIRVIGRTPQADVTVSVFTYPNADHYWVSTIPRGAGQRAAKRRINEQAPILRRYLRPELSTQRGVTHIVHAEEGAFSLFEASGEFPFEAGAQTYPPGSVVGSWNMLSGDKKEERKPENIAVGQERSVCKPTLGQEVNSAKNNRACEVVTNDLRVAARLENGQVRIPGASAGTATQPATGKGTKRPASPGDSDDDHKRPKNDPGEGSSKCARGLIPRKQGTVVACLLPTAKHSTKSRPTTLRTVHTAAAGTRTGKSKPTATGAARQRPTNTRLAKTKATTALRQKHTGTRPAHARSTVAGHQKPASTRPGRPAKTTKAAAARTGRPKTQKKPA